MSCFFSKLHFPRIWWSRSSAGRNTSQEPTERDLKSQLFEKAPAGFCSRLFSCRFSRRSKGNCKPKTSYHHQRTEDPAPHTMVPNHWQSTTAANAGITDFATTSSTTKHHHDDGKVVKTLEAAGPSSADGEAGSSTTIPKADDGKKIATYDYPVFSAAESSAASSFEMSTTDDDESTREHVIIRPPPEIHLVSTSINNGGLEDPYFAAAFAITRKGISAWMPDDQPFHYSSERQASAEHSPDTTTLSRAGSTRLAAASDRSIFRDWEEYINPIHEEWE